MLRYDFNILVKKNLIAIQNTAIYAINLKINLSFLRHLLLIIYGKL